VNRRAVFVQCHSLMLCVWGRDSKYQFYCYWFKPTTIHTWGDHTNLNTIKVHALFFMLLSRYVYLPKDPFSWLVVYVCCIHCSTYVFVHYIWKMSPLTTIQHCEEQSMYLNGVKVDGIYISQLIWYSKDYGSFQDFLDKRLLTRMFLKQGFLLVNLKSSLRKFYGRHHKKGRQHSGQKKTDKRTNNHLQNITHTTKDRVTRTSGVPEG
jgi:hypothetical protein